MITCDRETNEPDTAGYDPVPNDTASEFEEETGFQAAGEFADLGSIKQKSGKVVSACAFEGDCDPDELTSNTCEIEWPPRSGRRLEIPEVDRGRWFSISEANEYIRDEQCELLRRLSGIV
jgi:predicted NUDIX family NTP pyrophosphohydrolase